MPPRTAKLLAVSLLAIASACDRTSPPSLATAQSDRAEERAAPPAAREESAAAAPAAADAAPAPAPDASAEAPPDAARPTVNTPRGLSVAATSPSRIAVEWEPVTEGAVTGYRVFRDGAPVRTVTAAAFADDRLRPGTRHCYSVVALDASGSGSAPTRAGCAETPDTTAPTAPPGLHVEARGERQVLLRWEASSDDVAVAIYEVSRAGALVAKVKGTAVTESGLAPAQTYCYTVRALDASGNASAATEPRCASTPDLTPPSRPDSLTAEPDGEHAIRLGWAPSADDVGVAAYELLRDGHVVATATEPSAREDGLRTTVKYCYTVRALDRAGNRSQEAGPACATPPDLTPPTAPANLLAKAVSDTRVELHWTASSDEIGVKEYEVLRSQKPLGATGSTGFAEAGLRPGHEYCYFVRARDAAGNVSPASARACATTPDVTPPTAPAHVAVAPRSPFSVALAWGESTDDVAVAGYEIRRGGELVARLDGSATYHEDTGLQPATDACYAIVAFDAAGNRSPSNATLCARTAEAGVPAAPSRLRAAPETLTSIALSWNASPDPEVVYAVYWDRGGRIGSTGNTRFSATVKRGERRCFRVAAVNAEGRESPRTFDACATAQEDAGSQTAFNVGDAAAAR